MPENSNTILRVVDIGSIFEGTTGHDEDLLQRREKAASLLLAAFEQEGMAYLRFTGSSLSKFNSAIIPAFTAASRFFSRPLTEKNTALPSRLPTGVTRGYLGTGVESGASQFESKEAFSWSCDWDSSSHNPGNPLEFGNVWPQSPEGHPTDFAMKRAFDTLFTFMNSVMLQLVSTLTSFWPSHYPALPDLGKQCETGNSISLLRAFHYYATSASANDCTGSCAHTDWGFATLIAQQLHTSPALQVFHNSRWVAVPPLPDTLVVNCSDFLSMLTNGILRSPLHRVILTPTNRLSFVYFQYPGYKTPVPTLSPSGTLRTSSLSLLKNQSPNPDSVPAHKIAKSFGELIALKWQQVSR